MGVRMAEVVTLTHFAFSNSNHLLHRRLPHHHHIHRRSPPPSPYGLHVTVHERRTSALPSNFVTVICRYCHPLIESVDNYLLRFHLLFPPSNLMSIANLQICSFNGHLDNVLDLMFQISVTET
ncbi:hypothetical protein LXL04_010940 [Taraxacum kok-saghyz]